MHSVKANPARAAIRSTVACTVTVDPNGADLRYVHDSSVDTPGRLSASLVITANVVISSVGEEVVVRR